MLLDSGRPKEALEVLRQSGRAQRRVGRLEVLAETLRLQALAMRALGNTDEARHAVQLALAHAEKTRQVAAVFAAKETLTKIM